MADDGETKEGKQPMQAAGPGDNPAGGSEGPGESGGGTYPNPHTGKTPKGGVMGHGGQTGITERPDGEEND